MSEPQFSRTIFRGQFEANQAFARASDRTFYAWIKMSLVYFVFGVSLFILNPPIAQPLGLLVASGFVVLGILATASAFMGDSLVGRHNHARARSFLRALRTTIWAGAALVMIAGVVGLAWYD